MTLGIAGLDEGPQIVLAAGGGCLTGILGNEICSASESACAYFETYDSLKTQYDVTNSIFEDAFADL